MSAIPAYFKGGIAPGSHVNVTYIGDLETTSLEEVRIIAVTGEDPDTINDKHISFTVTGTIIGSTANTITVQTDDGAIDTFRTENAQRSHCRRHGIRRLCVCYLPSIQIKIF